MAYYAITYVYAGSGGEGEVRPGSPRVPWLADGGGNPDRFRPPAGGEAPAGALLIAKVDSAEAAEKIVANDPMNVGGAVLSHTVTEWNPVLGTI